MKKILLSLFVFASLLISTNAFASITYYPDSPQFVNTPIEINCGAGNSVYYFNPDFVGAGNCGATTTFETYGNYTFIECLNGYDCGSTTIQDARDAIGFISENTYRINAEQQTGLSAGIFYARDPETGESTANDLVAMVGNASGITMETMGGIVGVIGGIIFAFGFILYIRSIINEANIEKKRKEKGL